MKRYVLMEVERVRGDAALLEALRAVARAINDLSSRVQTGDATLENGAALVTVPGLQAGTRIVAGHLVPAGTPGPVYADPAEYDVPRERAVIRSTSGSDQSRVAWIAGTEG